MGGIMKSARKVLKTKQKTAPKALKTNAKQLVKSPAKTAPTAKTVVKTSAKAAMPAAKAPLVANAKTKIVPPKAAPKAGTPVTAKVAVKPGVPAAPVKANNDNAAAAVEFNKGDYVVYPAHGVGLIENIEIQTIAGMQIKLYAIAFEKDRMRLKVPVFKAQSAGLRRLSSENRLKDALKTLKGKAKIRRTMWSRRAQEYETKINSGDPVSIAEVLRDLKRSNDDHEQSYSERQIYQSALQRLAREVAAVEKITEIQAAAQLEKILGRAVAPAMDASAVIAAA